MRELPEVARAAAQVQSALTGKTVAFAEANKSPHKFAFFNIDTSDFERALIAQTINGAQAHGGMLTINLSRGRLVFGDGANIIYYPDSVRLPQKHQLRIDFEDSGHIIMSVSMYGFISYYEGFESTDNGYYEIAIQKPSPYSEGFTYEHFRAQLMDANPAKCSLKEYLATKQRIPGLGNGVLHDILFNAKMSPRRKLDTLSEDDWRELYECVKRTLSDMLARGGRDVERDLFGAPGGYATLMSKHTLTKPCPRCSSEIRREAYLGGNVYYCPNCQK